MFGIDHARHLAEQRLLAAIAEAAADMDPERLADVLGQQANYAENRLCDPPLRMTSLVPNCPQPLWPDGGDASREELSPWTREGRGMQPMPIPAPLHPDITPLRVEVWR